ncbi:MAG TPA: hypothetical protein VGK67_05155 [Myxococcales bacterium]
MRVLTASASASASALGLLLAACPAPAPVSPTCLQDAECAQGEHCLLGRCLADACGDRPCRAGEACVAGACLAADCVEVKCPEGESCAKGRCYPVECGVQSCTLTDVCVEQECSEPSCVGVACGDGEVCAAGRCRPTACAGVVCVDGDACEGGSCASTRCVGVVCSAGTLCADGRCVPTSCDGLVCAAGQVCLGGACVDPACVNRTCEAGFRCAGGVCRACAGREAACGDGEDDDCDGRKDCADEDCEGFPCGAASFCQAGGCLPVDGADAGVGSSDAGAGCSASERRCGGACIPVTGCCELSECGLFAEDCVANVCRCGGAAACRTGEVCFAGVCEARCLVDGQIYLDGAVDQSNTCRSCQPAVATDAFSPRAEGEVCGPGRVCVQVACQRGCWIDGAYRATDSPNPANAYQACVPDVSATAWTDSIPVPDSWFAKASPATFGCGLTSAAGTAACVGAFGAGWVWPDASLSLHGPAYEAAKREAAGVAREYFVYGTDAVPGYYYSSVDSSSGSAGRGSAFACPADRKLLCARPAHSPFRASGPAHFTGSTLVFDELAGRFAVFFVGAGVSGVRELRLQFLTRQGALVGGPVTLSSGFGDLNNPSGAPRIHADFEPFDRRFRLFYTKGVEANGRYALYAMTLDQDGAVVLPEHAVESGTYDLNDALDVAVDRANRRYLLAYAFSDLATYALRARYVGPDDAVGASFDLEADNYNLTTLAAAFAEQPGTFFIAYPSKTGSGVTVKVVASGANGAAGTGTVAASPATRLRLAASSTAATALLAYASPSTGNVYTQLLSSTGGASGSSLRINAFAGEASSPSSLELGFDAAAGRYLVAYDYFLQAVTPANAKAISTVEESIAGGHATPGIVQALAFDGAQGTAAVLQRDTQVGVGLLFTLRQANFDVY